MRFYAHMGIWCKGTNNFFITLKNFEKFFFLSFLKRNKIFIVLFSGAEKRTKRDIHPHQTSPYMERLKQGVAETADSLCVLVSRDTAYHF